MFRAGLPISLRKLDSCLAVLPNRFRSQVMSPNHPVEVSSSEATPIILPSRKGSSGSTCNSVDDIVTTPAEICERSDLGVLASPLLSQERERQVRAHSGLIILVEKVLKRPSHTFVPARRNPLRDVKTRESQVETRVLCKILIQEQEHRCARNCLEFRADRAVRVERVVPKFSEAEYHTRRLLEEQNDYLLSEAQSVSVFSVLTVDRMYTFTLPLYTNIVPCLCRRQTQFSCTIHSLTRARTWIEQASSRLSLRNKNSSHCHLEIIHNRS